MTMYIHGLRVNRSAPHSEAVPTRFFQFAQLYRLESGREGQGLSSDVIVRRRDELEVMVKKNSFKDVEHGGQWYLTVPFRKDRQPPIFNKLERATMEGPEFMAGLEKRYGKHITTRTWNTLLKIIAKMQTKENENEERERG